jgi:cyclase
MSTGHGHDDRHLDPPRVEEVADRVFAYIQPDGTWWINNTGFVVADDGIVAIDTCATERRTRAFLASVAEVSAAPLRVVVNTHHHGDHTHGNYLTHPATIIGHTRCRDLVVASGLSTYEGVFETPDWGHLELAPPMVTFDDHLDVWAGDLKVELHHVGTPAHTTNDVVAWLPERRVLFAGDLVFNGGTPFTVMGSVAGSITAVESLRRFDAEVVVPGHGPVCDPSVLDGLVGYLGFVQRAAAEAVAAGVGPLEAARELDLGEFAGLSDPERIVGNLHRAMLEAGGAAPGAPLDVPAAIGDMIAFNGGRPLRCLA